jgi:hypothetical protein
MHDTLAATTRAVLPGPWWSELARLAAAGGLCVLLLFLIWEGVERTFAGDDRAAHRVHYARGVSTSVFTACAVGLVGWRQHRCREAVLSALAARRAQDAREARQLLEMVVDATPAASLAVLGGMALIFRRILAREAIDPASGSSQAAHAS